MYSTKFWSILLVVYAGVILECSAEAGNHYPIEHSDNLPCAQKQNIVDMQAEICTLKDGKFTEESIANCEKLKSSCPEFNKATCEKLDIRYPEPTDPVQSLPCCRLKYFSSSFNDMKCSKFTWMEIYYTNQYRPGDYDFPVYDIVEVHRFIKFKFDGLEQDDWPKSVPNYKGERGLKWCTLDHPADKVKLTKPFPERSASSPVFCPPGKEEDPQCNVDMTKHLNDTLQTKFEDEKILETSCVDILVDKKKTRACRVTYGRPPFGAHLKKKRSTVVEVYVGSNKNSYNARYALFPENV